MTNERTYRVEFEDKNGRRYNTQYHFCSIEKIRETMENNIKGNPRVLVFAKTGKVVLDSFQG